MLALSSSPFSSSTGVNEFILALQGISQTNTLLLGNDVSLDTTAKFLLQANETGKLTCEVRNYAHWLVEERTNGMACQRFGHALLDELSAGDQFLVSLEQHEPAFHLCQLFVKVKSHVRRIQLLWNTCESVRSMRGGILVSGLYSLKAGLVGEEEALVSRLLEKSNRPLDQLCRQYCATGSCEQDEQEEFFLLDTHEWNINMKPTFVSLELAQRIARLGSDSLMADKLRCAIAATSEPDLEKFVSDMEVRVHLALKKTLWEEHHLVEHLLALKSFLLLAQGDFSQVLLENLPLPTLRMERLVILEQAVMNSNASKRHAHVLSNLDVLNSSEFCLVYRLPFPLNELIDTTGYKTAFTFLFSLKQTHHAMVVSWKTFQVQRRNQHSQVLHTKHFLCSEMLHLMNNLFQYVMVDVMEPAWEEMLVGIRNSKSLEHIRVAHKTFITQILLNGMMEESPPEILIPTIGAVMKLSQSPLSCLKSKVSPKDVQGLSVRLHELLRLVQEFSMLPSNTSADYLARRYGDALRVFLTGLRSCASSQTLQSLAQRVDFNRFYC